MSQHQAQEPFTPWHKEPWAWYILSILLVTFCWGGFQLYTAFSNQDSVVVDDYYKVGKAINGDKTRIKAARALNISATLTIDELIGEVRVSIRGNIEDWPGQLQLSFLSPVFADQDKIITLKKSISGNSIPNNSIPNNSTPDKSAQIYVGQLAEQVAGRYYVQLETQDQFIPEVGFESGWKITQEAFITEGETLSLQSSSLD